MKSRKHHLPPEFRSPLMPCNVPVQRCPVPREQASHRILIMLTGAHGDIVMGTPFLAALRQSYPEAHLTWIVEHTDAEAIDANPFIDEYIFWDGYYWKRMMRRGWYPLWVVRALKMKRELRRRQYDIYVTFKGEEWPLLAYGVGAPLSMGVFDTFRQYYGATRTSRRTRLYTHAYAYPHVPPHRVDQYLLPLRALEVPLPVAKKMYIGYTADDVSVVESFLEEHRIHGSIPLVVIAPMTTWPSRCWPSERYAQLGDALMGGQHCRVVLIGSRREEEAVANVAAQMRVQPIIASGIFSFRQMAALIARASLLVSGDTGPMHVASAVDTPFVALFGPTPVAERAPLSGRGLTLMHPVPCGPCDQERCPNTGEDFMRCMKLLTVDEVYEAASALLGSPKKSHEYSHH